MHKLTQHESWAYRAYYDSQKYVLLYTFFFSFFFYLFGVLSIEYESFIQCQTILVEEQLSS